MRINLTSILVLFINSLVHGQNIKYTQLASFKNKSISIYSVKFNYEYTDTNLNEKDKPFYEIIMTFNNHHDTVRIESNDYVTKYLDTLYVNPFQIDNNKEGVIITRKLKERSNLGEHGDYIINKTVNEIWDIESCKRIFSSINNFSFYSDFYSYFEDSITLTEYSNFSYHYELKFIEGKIVISDIKIINRVKYGDEKNWTQINNPDSYPGFDECLKPDFEEGVYYFQNGVYKKSKSGG